MPFDPSPKVQELQHRLNALRPARAVLWALLLRAAARLGRLRAGEAARGRLVHGAHELSEYALHHVFRRSGH